MADTNALKEVIEHLEWAIQSSRDELTFGMGTPEKASFSREMRLRGSANEAKKFLKKLYKDLKENGHGSD